MCDPAAAAIQVMPLLLMPFIFSLVFGYLSGWQLLAKKYPHRGPIPSETRWNFISIPNAALRNCVHVAIDAQGIYFQIFLLFRLGNRTIFVPWSDLIVSSPRGIFLSTVSLRFRNAPGVSFQFYESTIKEIERAAGKFWPRSAA